MAAGFVALLAAGCNASKPAVQAPPERPSSAVSQPAPQNQSSVKIGNADDALSTLDARASSEESLTAGVDDSDLTANDAAELNGFTEVPNGN